MNPPYSIRNSWLALALASIPLAACTTPARRAQAAPPVVSMAVPPASVSAVSAARLPNASLGAAPSSPLVMQIDEGGFSIFQDSFHVGYARVVYDPPPAGQTAPSGAPANAEQIRPGVEYFYLRVNDKGIEGAGQKAKYRPPSETSVGVATSYRFVEDLGKVQPLRDRIKAEIRAGAKFAYIKVNCGKPKPIRTESDV